MASNVLPVSIIKQRMNQDAANYLLGNEPVSIDMLLVTAATPAIHADFKNAKPEELNGILKQIQKFLKSHMRFLNFDKEAAMKGLSEEWLDSIDGLFSIYEAMPVIIELWTEQQITTAKPKNPAGPR